VGGAARYSSRWQNGSQFVPSYTQIDAWIDYDFERTGHRFTGWRQHLLEGLKISVRGIDILPKEPRFNTFNGYIVGRGNPYQGQYQIDIRKTF
jgi:hypothetical protein